MVENERALEFLVLSGVLAVGGEMLEAQGWGRLPAGMDLKAAAGPQGVRIWIKDAPLLHSDVLEMPA